MQCIHSCTCVHTHNAISHPCTQHARTRANMQVTRNTLMHDAHVMHMRIPHTTQHTREHTIHTSTGTYTHACMSHRRRPPGRAVPSTRLEPWKSSQPLRCGGLQTWLPASAPPRQAGGLELAGLAVVPWERASPCHTPPQPHWAGEAEEPSAFHGDSQFKDPRLTVTVTPDPFPSRSTLSASIPSPSSCSG